MSCGGWDRRAGLGEQSQGGSPVDGSRGWTAGWGFGLGPLAKDFSTRLWGCSLRSLLGCSNSHTLSFHASDNLRYTKPIGTHTDHP